MGVGQGAGGLAKAAGPIHSLRLVRRHNQHRVQAARFPEAGAFNRSLGFHGGPSDRRCEAEANWTFARRSACREQDAGQFAGFQETGRKHEPLGDHAADFGERGVAAPTLAGRSDDLADACAGDMAGRGDLRLAGPGGWALRGKVVKAEHRGHVTAIRA